jgi:hypothetical protein
MNRAHCPSFWSAPAERSDDGGERRQFESGVALRLPPHSKNELRDCFWDQLRLAIRDRFGKYSGQL